MVGAFVQYVHERRIGRGHGYFLCIKERDERKRERERVKVKGISLSITGKGCDRIIIERVNNKTRIILEHGGFRKFQDV